MSRRAYSKRFCYFRNKCLIILKRTSRKLQFL